MFCSTNMLFSETEGPTKALIYNKHDLAEGVGSFGCWRVAAVTCAVTRLNMAGLKIAPTNSLPKFITLNIINMHEV